MGKLSLIQLHLGVPVKKTHFLRLCVSGQLSTDVGYLVLKSAKLSTVIVVQECSKTRMQGGKLLPELSARWTAQDADKRARYAFSVPV